MYKFPIVLIEYNATSTMVHGFIDTSLELIEQARQIKIVMNALDYVAVDSEFRIEQILPLTTASAGEHESPPILVMFRQWEQTNVEASDDPNNPIINFANMVTQCCSRPVSTVNVQKHPVD